MTRSKRPSRLAFMAERFNVEFEVYGTGKTFVLNLHAPPRAGEFVVHNRERYTVVSVTWADMIPPRLVVVEAPP